MSTSVERPRPAAPPPVQGSSRWLLVALVVASLAVLALIIPAVRVWRDTPAPQLTELQVAIRPLTADEKDECPPFGLERLDRATTAVTGQILTVVGNKATVEADHWFRGGPADLVTLTAATPDDLATALRDNDMHTGRVLIASRSGQVLLCGESSAWSTSLASDYVTAFEQR